VLAQADERGFQMSSSTQLIIFFGSIFGGVAVLVGGVFLVLKIIVKRRIPPASLVAAQGVTWRQLGSDSGLLWRFRGGPLEPVQVNGDPQFRQLERPVGQTMDTVYRGYHAIAFTFGYLSHLPRGGDFSVNETIVSLDLPRPMPILQLVPSRLGSSVGDTLDQRFNIDTNSPEFAHAVFQSPLAGWLLTDPRAKYYAIRIEGVTLSSWTGGTDSGGVLPMGRVEQMLGFLVELVERLPASVWQHS
jgi:hypothetical protein